MPSSEPVDDLGEVGFGVEAVQLGGLDEAVDGGSPLAARVRAGEQPVLPAQRNHGVILPMSRMKSSSTIGGIRCMGALCGGTTASVGQTVRSSMSR